jgi:DegV family protein with EDD domain
MQQIQVVTDSAADIPPQQAAELGITVVPLTIHFGDKTYHDGEDLTPTEFYALLKSNSNFPRTSQPSVGRFEQAYRTLGGGGAEIISIHLSSRLSGTFASATTASRNVEGARVHLVDSLVAAMAQGELVLAAAQMVRDGRGVPEILQHVDSLRQRMHIGIMLDNLTHLQRGGRIGRAQGLLGTLLNVKPIVALEDGVVVPRQRVRTTARALEELAGGARAWGALERMHIVHANAPALVEQLQALLRPFAPGEVPVDFIGPVVGTHVGAGAIGLLSIKQEDRSRQ